MSESAKNASNTVMEKTMSHLSEERQKRILYTEIMTNEHNALRRVIGRIAWFMVIVVFVLIILVWTQTGTLRMRCLISLLVAMLVSMCGVAYLEKLNHSFSKIRSAVENMVWAIGQARDTQIVSQMKDYSNLDAMRNIGLARERGAVQGASIRQPV